MRRFCVVDLKPFCRESAVLTYSLFDRSPAADWHVSGVLGGRLPRSALVRVRRRRNINRPAADARDFVRSKAADLQGGVLRGEVETLRIARQCSLLQSLWQHPRLAVREKPKRTIEAADEWGVEASCLSLSRVSYPSLCTPKGKPKTVPVRSTLCPGVQDDLDLRIPGDRALPLLCLPLSAVPVGPHVVVPCAFDLAEFVAWRRRAEPADLADYVFEPEHATALRVLSRAGNLPVAVHSFFKRRRAKKPLRRTDELRRDCRQPPARAKAIGIVTTRRASAWLWPRKISAKAAACTKGSATTESFSTTTAAPVRSWLNLCNPTPLDRGPRLLVY